MKIALAQINCHIGNFDANTGLIIKHIEQSRASGAELVVFPEMAVCGYPPMDLLESQDFIIRCTKAIDEIAKHCIGITAVVGSPSSNPSPKGKNLFNSAYVLADGKIKDIFHKTLLPTYDVFDEYRYFEPNTVFKTIELNEKRVAVTICEDLWNEEDDPMYTFSPLEKTGDGKIDLVINIAASPFDFNHREKRISILQRNAAKFKSPIVYVNHAGAQNDLVFDGGSMVLDAAGSLLYEASYFEESLSICDLTSPQSSDISIPQSKNERIRQALVCGIRDYFRKCGFKDAVLGLSGGVDSALVAVLAVEALGAEHVHPVLMPSAFSSEHSIQDALELCELNGLKSRTIPINHIYDKFLNELAPSFEGKPFDIAEENVQSRTRGTILMALSNKHRYVLLNTSNKSELAVGYGTLYGDMAGGLSVIGDLYKTEVYALCDHLNSTRIRIPQNILTKAPSAELRPGQKDSDSLPDYDLLDRILFHHIEGKLGSSSMIEMGFDPEVVSKVLSLVSRSEYKRFQFAPIIRVSTKAFGTGRRYPLVASYS
ncbi:MAG: NAD+ synthase [Bacteroidota bacterium]